MSGVLSQIPARLARRGVVAAQIGAPSVRFASCVLIFQNCSMPRNQLMGYSVR